MVTGIPTGGTVRVGEILTLLPGAATGHVRRLQVYGADSTDAHGGECVALNIPEIDHTSVRRGMLLCPAGAVETVTMAEAEFEVLASLKKPVEDYLEVHVHIGTAAVAANLALLEGAEMSAGQSQFVQLRLQEPLPLAPGDRFVLRANMTWPGHSGLTTIGGGRILGTSNLRLRRRKPWTLESLAARRTAIGDPVRWLSLITRERSRPTSAAELQRLCLLTPDELARTLEPLRLRGEIVVTPAGLFVHAAAVRDVAAKIRDAMTAFHAANPQRARIERDALAAQSGADPALFELAADQLMKAGEIGRSEMGFAAAGWSAQLPNREQALSDEIAGVFQKSGWSPPAAGELAASLRQPPAKVEKIIRLLTETGVLVKLGDDLQMHRDAVGAAKQVVLRLLSTRPLFTTMEFRDAVSVSRKYAVPLLDHLDRVRFTVRNGHNRTAGVEARKLLAANVPTVAVAPAPPSPCLKPQ